MCVSWPPRIDLPGRKQLKLILEARKMRKEMGLKARSDIIYNRKMSRELPSSKSSKVA